jgi:hypothetical protein
MKTLISRLMTLSALALIAGSVAAQQPASMKANQTQGFGEGKVLEFTYTQNFDCIDQPNDDLNYNKIKAASDPGEMQTPTASSARSPRSIRPDKKGTLLKRRRHSTF